MKKVQLLIGVVAGITLFLWGCQKDPLNDSGLQDGLMRGRPEPCPMATYTVYATGLNNPRGLKFDSHGDLFVAEGGTGGTDSTDGECTQVVFPVGKYYGSQTGAGISRITPDGVRHVVTDQFPSSQTSKAAGNLVSGVADIAFIGNDLYAILAGAGCSHGVRDIPNGIARVNPDGSWTMIADLSSWQMAHPVANSEEDDFEPDGTWYSMINVRDNLYAIEPNHGEMVRVTPDGQISRVIDISATQGHIVPTVVAYDGNFYVGNLHTFPIDEGSSNIYKITPSGQIKVWATGFTTVTGICFDHQGNLYVLENTTGNAEPTPGTGTIVRLNHSGQKSIVVTGLDLPTGMTCGPDGNLYVSNWGFGPPAIGGGQVLKVDISNCNCNDNYQHGKN